MGLMHLVKSRWGPPLALELARRLPRRQAYALGDSLLRLIAREPDHPFMRGLRVNLSVLHGLPESHPDIDRAIGRLFSQTTRGYVDFARAAASGGDAVVACCRVDPGAVAAFERARAEGRGVVLVGAHTCSFDFVLVTAGRRLRELVTLSKPEPKGSADTMNQIRSRLGVNMRPISPAALREAVRCLRTGGIVACAIDVPTEDGEEFVFLGRKARLPMGHARLALSTGAHLMVGLSHRLGPGSYEVVGKEVPRPPEMGDRHQQALRWAQAAVLELERFLRRWPDEWLMPEAIWQAAASTSPRAPISLAAAGRSNPVPAGRDR